MNIFQDSCIQEFNVKKNWTFLEVWSVKKISKVNSFQFLNVHNFVAIDIEFDHLVPNDKIVRQDKYSKFHFW